MKKILVFLLLAVSISAMAKDQYSYHFQRAEEAYRQKNYTECVRICQQGVEADPKDGYCWAILAEIYSKRDFAQYAEALEASVQALNTLPKKENYFRAYMYNIRGDVYYKVGDYQHAKIEYQQALRFYPNDANYLTSLADVYFELGEYEESNRLYDKVLADDPSPAYVYTQKAENYIKLGMTEQARQACQMSLVLNPTDNVAAYDLLARIAYDEGNYPLAAQQAAEAVKSGMSVRYYDIVDSLCWNAFPIWEGALRRIIEQAPTDDNRWTVLGLQYETRLRYADALYCYLQAAQFDEEEAGMAYLLSSTYDELEDYDKAIEQALLLLKQDSTASAFWYRVGSYLSDACRYEEAETYFAKALDLEPTSSLGWKKRARNLHYQHRYSEALQAYDTSISTADPSGLPAIYLDRGLLLEAMGRHEEAVADWQTCVSYAQGDTLNYATYGMAYAYLGNIVNATAMVGRLIEKNTRGLYHGGISMVYAAMKDRQRTLEHLRLSFEHGTRDANVKRTSLRYEFLWQDPEFLALCDQYASIARAELAEVEKRLQPESVLSGVTEIPFTRQGGVNQVKCSINGLPLYFVFDTGAADVTISSVEANFMLKNGYLTDADFMGKQNFVTATGEIHEGTIINLREVRVGDITLTNIKASVVKSQSAPLLLGQTVFRRFGTIEVDNEHSIIRMTK